MASATGNFRSHYPLSCRSIIHHIILLMFSLQTYPGFRDIFLCKHREVNVPKSFQLKEKDKNIGIMSIL